MKKIFFALFATLMLLAGCTSTGSAQADATAGANVQADQKQSAAVDAAAQEAAKAEVQAKATADTKAISDKISAAAQQLQTVSAQGVADVKANLPLIEADVEKLKAYLVENGVAITPELENSLAQLASLRTKLEAAVKEMEVKDISAQEVADQANKKLPGTDTTLNEELKKALAESENVNSTTTPNQSNGAVVDSKITSDNWCPAGSTVDVTAQGATSNTVIEGLVSFKGQTFCKGVSKTVIQSPIGTMEVSTEYYFNEKVQTKADGREMWVVTKTPVAGQTQTTEIHMINDQLVG